jgi:signal transduction histidine kinase
MTRRWYGRLTLRARLTLVYGGLFLLAGIGLLGVTYLLVSQQLPGSGGQHSVASCGAGPSAAAQGQSSPECPTVTGQAGDTALADKITEDARHTAQAALLAQGGIALGGVGVIAIGSGWLIAGRMLRPLQRMTDTARRIAQAPAADRELHERIALTGPPDELKNLADTFDLMLERLDQSFDGQRRFIANASHELRTPLTLNRALLEVAVHRRAAPPEVVQLGETLLEINTRHERLIEGLLLLTRSEAQISEPSYVDMGDIVEHVVATNPRGTVAVHADPGEAPTRGSPVLLERLVHNLVENGVRYNVPQGGWVRVGSGTGPDGTVRVTVTNTGPVVPRYEVPTLFEPFRRLGTDRLAGSPGAGLGLSIVRAVARAHGGEVRAEPRDGGGLTVTVTLPHSR